MKWGGSLITDKTRPEHAHLEIIERLARELAAAIDASDRDSGPRLILGHGSGSFGHAAARRLGMGAGQKAVDPRAAMEVRVAAARLHGLVSSALVRAGVAAWSWAPSVVLRAREGRPVAGSIDGLERALGHGLVPVTYGDVLMDATLGASIASTEAVMRFLVGRLRRRRLKPVRLLWMGQTAGIYDRDGRTVPRIDGHNLKQVYRMIDGPAGIDVTGGMLLRLRTAWDLARIGLDSWILDGTVPGLFEAALRGERVPGTVVSAAGPHDR